MPTDRILTISSLGRLGRFGNQLFQLCFGLGLARRFGAQLQIPADWPGRRLFKLDVPVIQSPPKIKTTFNYIPTQEEFDQAGTVDLVGFWQFQEAIDLYSREDVLTWLAFQDWVMQRFPPQRAPNGPPVVAIHKRRGDYLNDAYVKRFCTVTSRSYYRCIDEQVMPEFAAHPDIDLEEICEYSAWRDRACESLGLGFLPDFMRLIHADLVVRSNSTFAYWAVVLGNNTAYAPLVEDKVGWSDVSFVKGNHPRFVDPKYFGSGAHTDLWLREHYADDDRRAAGAPVGDIIPDGRQDQGSVH